MTPKHRALLTSIAAIKDGVADEYQSLMSRLDDVEAGRASIGDALPALRGGITRLSHSVVTVHDTAAVMAEPMSIPDAPAASVEVAPAPALDQPAAVVQDQAPDKEPPVTVRNVKTRDAMAEGPTPVSRNGGKAEG